MRIMIKIFFDTNILLNYLHFQQYIECVSKNFQDLKTKIDELKKKSENNKNQFLCFCLVDMLFYLFEENLKFFNDDSIEKEFKELIKKIP